MVTAHHCTALLLHASVDHGASRRRLAAMDRRSSRSHSPSSASAIVNVTPLLSRPSDSLSQRTRVARRWRRRRTTHSQPEESIGTRECEWNGASAVRVGRCTGSDCLRVPLLCALRQPAAARGSSTGRRRMATPAEAIGQRPLATSSRRYSSRRYFASSCTPNPIRQPHFSPRLPPFRPHGLTASFTGRAAMVALRAGCEPPRSCCASPRGLGPGASIALLTPLRPSPPAAPSPPVS